MGLNLIFTNRPFFQTRWMIMMICGSGRRAGRGVGQRLTRTRSVATNKTFGWNVQPILTCADFSDGLVQLNHQLVDVFSIISEG